MRTIVEVETDNGIVGLGEMGGGGESAEAAIHGLKSYLIGHDPAKLEEMRFRMDSFTAVADTPQPKPTPPPPPPDPKPTPKP